MNKSDFEDKLPSSFIGKEVIIVTVVIFSALSFTLGFFVGKSTVNKSPAPAAQITEIPPSLQKQEPLSEQPVAHEETSQHTLSATEQSQKNTQAEQQNSDVLIRGKDIKSVKEISKKPLNEQAMQDKESGSSHEPSAKSKITKKTIIYTVQLGAFKNVSEAENFRNEYDKKGYRTYTVISENKKREKIYKIRTGEFNEKKDAEIFSLKLKKTEGVNSFVAFKSE